MYRLDNTKARALYLSLKSKYQSTSSNFAILKVSVQDDSLRNEYIKHIEAHNAKMTSNFYYDSGFDVFFPDDAIFYKYASETEMINLKIKTEMLYCDTDKDVLSPSPFYMYPRSSISKTPLMLANHVGIIDSGYRGNLIGAFRYLDNEPDKQFIVNKYTRLLQICHSSLCPIIVMIVDENELTNTERGDNGFGSTGK